MLRSYCVHPNVVSFYGAFFNGEIALKPKLWLAMELCEFGSITVRQNASSKLYTYYYYYYNNNIYIYIYIHIIYNRS